MPQDHQGPGRNERAHCVLADQSAGHSQTQSLQGQQVECKRRSLWQEEVLQLADWKERRKWLPELYDMGIFRFEFSLRFRKERARSLGEARCSTHTFSGRRAIGHQVKFWDGPGAVLGGNAAR